MPPTSRTLPSVSSPWQTSRTGKAMPLGSHPPTSVLIVQCLIRTCYNRKLERLQKSSSPQPTSSRSSPRSTSLRRKTARRRRLTSPRRFATPSGRPLILPKPSARGVSRRRAQQTRSNPNPNRHRHLRKKTHNQRPHMMQTNSAHPRRPSISHLPRRRGQATSLRRLRAPAHGARVQRSALQAGP